MKYTERLAVVETKIDDIKGDVTEIKNALVRNDNRYAPKWVESAIRWTLGVTGTALIGLGFSLLIR